MVWKVMELCCDLMETIYPAINAQVLDPDATECVCVCMSDRQKEHDSTFEPQLQ